MKTDVTLTPLWLETQAQVTACKYQFTRMNTLTLGIPPDKNRFLITFTYYAHGKSYTDEFTSPTYLEQGETFLVSYNPLAPQQNTKSSSSPVTKTPLFAIGVAGSVLLSLLYLGMMRGCNQPASTETESFPPNLTPLPEPALPAGNSLYAPPHLPLTTLPRR
jgi:hypothetical protein